MEESRSTRILRLLGLPNYETKSTSEKDRSLAIKGFPAKPFLAVSPLNSDIPTSDHAVPTEWVQIRRRPNRKIQFDGQTDSGKSHKHLRSSSWARKPCTAVSGLNRPSDDVQPENAYVTQTEVLTAETVYTESDKNESERDAELFKESGGFPAKHFLDVSPLNSKVPASDRPVPTEWVQIRRKANRKIQFDGQTDGGNSQKHLRSSSWARKPCTAVSGLNSPSNDVQPENAFVAQTEVPTAETVDTESDKYEFERDDELCKESGGFPAKPFLAVSPLNSKIPASDRPVPTEWVQIRRKANRKIKFDGQTDGGKSHKHLRSSSWAGKPCAAVSALNSPSNDVQAEHSLVTPTEVSTAETVDTSEDSGDRDDGDEEYAEESEEHSEVETTSESSELGGVEEMKEPGSKDGHVKVTKRKKKSRKGVQRYASVTNAITFTTTQKKDGKRRRDKRHCCYFCNRILTNNMARHFEMVHGKDIEVAKILAMDRNSKQRKKAFEVLLKSGDFYHNLNVLTMNEGELILVRRPDKQNVLNHNEFVPCQHCLGFMQKKYLWVHYKRCNGRINKDVKQTGKGPSTESSAMLFEILGPKVNENFRLEIINSFRDDEISRTCKQDELIVTVGGYMYEKYGKLQAELIRQSMRQLGRLKLELQKTNSEKKLAAWITVDCFDKIISAVKSIAGNDSEDKDSTKRNDFKIPSLAVKIGHLLRKCVAIESGTALRKGLTQRHAELKDFSELMNLEWAARVSSKALQTMEKLKMNSAQLLPLTTDLLKLNEFLKEKIDFLQKLLEHHCNKHSWRNFASLVLCRIILFNKRRSGEASRMTLDNYACRPSWSEQGTEELKNSLTPMETRLANRLTVVEIRGKRNRTVPVILTNEIKTCVDLLIKKRKEGEISKENKFIFALSKSSAANSHIRGSDCLRTACSSAKLISPEKVTSTKLRKYIATVCQIFDLKDNEKDWLANHLGHDIRVHKQFYSLHQSAVELTKVSRLLMAVDQGQAQKFSGKKLNEINLEDLPDMDVEEEIIPDDDYDKIPESVPLDVLEEEFVPTGVAKATIAKTENKRKGKSSQRTAWSSEEIRCVLGHFSSHIKRGTLPGKVECEKFITKNDAVKKRKWTDVKFYIKNQLTRLSRNVAI